MSEPVARLAQQHLHVADAPLGEAGLAVGQIQRPEAPEGCVVAQAIELGRVGVKALAPATQGLDVVASDVVEMSICMSVRRATLRAMTSIEGSDPPGKM